MYTPLYHTMPLVVACVINCHVLRLSLPVRLLPFGIGKKDAAFPKQGQTERSRRQTQNNCRRMVSAAIRQQLLQHSSPNIKIHLERREATRGRQLK